MKHCIRRLPRVLIIHLKRFHVHLSPPAAPVCRKVRTPVDVPSQLDLTPVVQPGSRLHSLVTALMGAPKQQEAAGQQLQGAVEQEGTAQQQQGTPQHQSAQQQQGALQQQCAMQQEPSKLPAGVAGCTTPSASSVAASPKPAALAACSTPPEPDLAAFGSPTALALTAEDNNGATTQTLACDAGADAGSAGGGLALASPAAAAAPRLRAAVLGAAGSPRHAESGPCSASVSVPDGQPPAESTPAPPQPPAVKVGQPGYNGGGGCTPAEPVIRTGLELQQSSAALRRTACATPGSPCTGGHVGGGRQKENRHMVVSPTKSKAAAASPLLPTAAHNGNQTAGSGTVASKIFDTLSCLSNGVQARPGLLGGAWDDSPTRTPPRRTTITTSAFFGGSSPEFGDGLCAPAGTATPVRSTARVLDMSGVEHT